MTRQKKTISTRAIGKRRSNSKGHGSLVNLLSRIVLALLALGLIIAVIGSLLPRDYETSASINIDAPPEKIFPLVNQLRFWSRWTYWNGHDTPGLEVEYSGPESGVGSIQTWTEPRGNGKLWVSESIENQSIVYQSDFTGFPTMNGSIQLESDGDQTIVRWNSNGSLPSGPFYGWFGMAFSNALSGQYNQSLKKLKQIVESGG